MDFPPGRMGLGEGQPRPKVTVLLLPGQQPPLYGELGREWGEELPGPRIWGQREEQRLGEVNIELIYIYEDLPISEFLKPGTLWVLNKCPSETETGIQEYQVPKDARRKNLQTGAGR